MSRCRWYFAICLSLWIGSATAWSAPGDWPQWRGADRTDVSQETGLLQDWPEGGPPQAWLFKDCGIGYSGPAIVGDQLYIMGARNGHEQLIALNAQTGTELWAVDLSDVLENNWGDGPRATPTVDGDRIYTMAAPGKLVCVNRKDGSIVWSKAMSDLGGEVPQWGYTESVLVDGNLVLCTPGGKQGTMAALNKETGELVWQSKGIEEGAQYSSIIAVNHAGKRQYVQLTQKYLFGVDAENGNVLWKSEWGGRVAVIPTPIYHDGHIYITAGYGVGCKLVKLDENQQVSTVYENKEMKNHHGGVILLDGHIFGHSDGSGWLCQNFMTGEPAWRERDGLGKGAIAYADGRFYCMSETGDVELIEASTEGWKGHGKFTLDPQTTLRKPDGRIWTHPVIANGRLYLRDQDLLFSFDIKAK